VTIGPQFATFQINYCRRSTGLQASFSGVLSAELGRSDHNSSTPALAYAPRSVLNLMLGGLRRARHGLGPSGVGTSRSPKSGKERARAKRAMQIFVRQLFVIEMRSLERRLTLEKWSRLHGEI
jgi:hypothetical protein